MKYNHIIIDKEAHNISKGFPVSREYNRFIEEYYEVFIKGFNELSKEESD